MSTGAVFVAHKKRITERNSHLAGEANGNSISNGCQAKTERRRQLAGVGTGRGGTKLHASVARSRVTASLATAAPWEPYFTDNPRIMAAWIFLQMFWMNVCISYLPASSTCLVNFTNDIWSRVPTERHTWHQLIKECLKNYILFI
jgi:hypothetical protein